MKNLRFAFIAIVFFHLSFSAWTLESQAESRSESEQVSAVVFWTCDPQWSITAALSIEDGTDYNLDMVGFDLTTDLDMAQFLERLKTVKAAALNSDDGVSAEAHTIEVPYESRVAYLQRLESDMYKDYQALDVTNLVGGEKTTVEIKAAYQPLDNKADQFEYCVLDFLQRLFEIVGIDDNPAFQRNQIANLSEQTQMVLMAAEYLDEEMLLKKLPWLTAEEIEDMQKRKADDEAGRIVSGPVIDDGDS